MVGTSTIRFLRFLRTFAKRRIIQDLENNLAALYSKGLILAALQSGNNQKSVCLNFSFYTIFFRKKWEKIIVSRVRIFDRMRVFQGSYMILQKSRTPEKSNDNIKPGLNWTENSKTLISEL